jgi:hypothetical protein
MILCIPFSFFLTPYAFPSEITASEAESNGSAVYCRKDIQTAGEGSGIRVVFHAAATGCSNVFLIPVSVKSRIFLHGYIKKGEY